MTAESALALALAGCVVGIASGLVLLTSTSPGLDRLGPIVSRRPSRPLHVRVVNRLGRRLGPGVLASMSPRRRAVIAHRLDVAGRPGGITLEGYAARKAGLATAGLAVGAIATVLGLAAPAIMPALTGLAWFGVDLSLARTARDRSRQIQRDLPDVLDVLDVTVGAGLGFRAALDRVSAQVESPLSEELRATLQQMRWGVSRRDAFDALRARCGAEGVDRMVTELLQAEELGAPIADALSAIALDLRRTAAQDARRRAAAVQPKVSLVITTLVVPGASILVLGGLLLGNASGLGAVFGG